MSHCCKNERGGSVPRLVNYGPLRAGSAGDRRSILEAEERQTILVTGGAGFIGGNFVLGAVAGDSVKVVTLDALTYAGNLDTLVLPSRTVRITPSSTVASATGSWWIVCFAEHPPVRRGELRRREPRGPLNRRPWSLYPD